MDILHDIGIDDDTLIYDINFPVQNVTAEEGEEEIPSLAKDLLGELDELPLEEITSLDTMSTEKLNSFNTDPVTDHLASEPNHFFLLCYRYERLAPTSLRHYHVRLHCFPPEERPERPEDLWLSRDDSSSTVVKAVTLQAVAIQKNSFHWIRRHFMSDECRTYTSVIKGFEKRDYDCARYKSEVIQNFEGKLLQFPFNYKRRSEAVCKTGGPKLHKDGGSQ